MPHCGHLEEDRVDAGVPLLADDVRRKTGVLVVQPRPSPGWKAARFKGLDDAVGDRLPDLGLGRQSSSPLGLVTTLRCPNWLCAHSIDPDVGEAAHPLPATEP